jgi:16S rRNA (uracil1498-N3)-methyltransferase
MNNPPAIPNTFRFFVAAVQIAQGYTTDADLIHQWVRVLRMRVGQEILLIDSDRQLAHRVVLTAVDKQRVDWQVRTVDPVRGEPTLQVTLAVGVMRAERFEWLLQKATELGVSQIIPLKTERSRSDGDVGLQKFERWGRIVREAAEQSERGRVPRICEPHSLARLCAQPQDTATFFLHEGEGTVPWRRCLPLAHAAVTLVSGPDGGFSEAECAMMQACGWQGVGLGRRILRAETAPLLGLSMALTYAGDYDGEVA